MKNGQKSSAVQRSFWNAFSLRFMEFGSVFSGAYALENSTLLMADSLRFRSSTAAAPRPWE